MEIERIPENKFVLCFNLKPYFLRERKNHCLTDEGDRREFLKTLLVIVLIYDGGGFLVF